MSFDLTGFGEVLPRWENFVETDPEVKDISGIPVLRIHMANEENEREMIRDMGDSPSEMLEAAGARNVRTHANPSDPRLAVHEAGTARMGKDPKKSVVNEFQQCHHIPNMFVMDASGFTSNPARTRRSRSWPFAFAPATTCSPDEAECSLKLGGTAKWIRRQVCVEGETHCGRRSFCVS